MEDYARLAKLVGVEAFMAFMERHATALNVEVMVGKRRGRAGGVRI